MPIFLCLCLTNVHDFFPVQETKQKLQSYRMVQAEIWLGLGSGLPPALTKLMNPGSRLEWVLRLGPGKEAIVEWRWCHYPVLPCGWRNEGQGKYEAYGAIWPYRGTSPVELHHGASFMCPANLGHHNACLHLFWFLDTFLLGLYLKVLSSIHGVQT